MPGLVDVERGAVKHAVNLGVDGDWLPLGDLLADGSGVPVVVENDVNAATLGAAALSGADDLVYLSIGTGLAAGLVLDGRLRRGEHGAAGEIGHVPVDPTGVLCQCGQRGCLETIASGSALAAAWPSGDVPPAQALFAAAPAGDPAAIAVAGPVRGRRRQRRPGAGLAVDPASDRPRRRRRPARRAAARRRSPGAARPGRDARRSSPRSTSPAGCGWCRTTRSPPSAPRCSEPACRDPVIVVRQRASATLAGSARSRLATTPPSSHRDCGSVAPTMSSKVIAWKTRSTSGASSRTRSTSASG